MTSIEEKVIDELREVYDPEIPINVYDLGLIYNVKYEDNSLYILMTLTSATCPTAEYLQQMVREAGEKIVGEGNVEVELTFDPAWSPERVSIEAREELGLQTQSSITPSHIAGVFSPDKAGSIGNVCFNCGISDEKVPIIECYFHGEKTKVCYKCLSKF